MFLVEAVANTVLKGASVVQVSGLCLLGGTNAACFEIAFAARIH